MSVGGRSASDVIFSMGGAPRSPPARRCPHGRGRRPVPVLLESHEFHAAVLLPTLFGGVVGDGFVRAEPARY